MVVDAALEMSFAGTLGGFLAPWLEAIVMHAGHVMSDRQVREQPSYQRTSAPFQQKQTVAYQ